MLNAMIATSTKRNWNGDLGTDMDAPLDDLDRKGSKSSSFETRRTRTSGFFLVCISVFLIGAQLSGCAATPLAPTEAEDVVTPRNYGDLEVRLVFGQEADLDLYVTDTRLETVYFGNNPGLSGGSLDMDRRCDDPSPRVEIVTIPGAVVGLYRVGVEFAERCRRVRGPVPFRIEVRSDGLATSKDGEIELGQFDNLVLEFELAPMRRP